MLCYEVSVNGGVICRAGVGSFGVLSAILSWVQTNAGNSETQDDKLTPSECNLSIGGLVNEEHLNWLPDTFTVKIGDKVTISIIDADSIDEPAERTDHADPAVARRNRYELYLIYKKEFEAEGVLLPEEEIDSKAALFMRKQLYDELKRELKG